MLDMTGWYFEKLRMLETARSKKRWERNLMNRLRFITRWLLQNDIWRDSYDEIIDAHGYSRKDFLTPYDL